MKNKLLSSTFIFNTFLDDYTSARMSLISSGKQGLNEYFLDGTKSPFPIDFNPISFRPWAGSTHHGDFSSPLCFFFDNHASDLISESIQIYLINLFKIKLTQLPNKINIPLYTSK
jgi:hypothetical protein